MLTSKPHSLHLKDGGSMVLQNAVILLHHYMASQPRRQWFGWETASQLWIRITSCIWNKVLSCNIVKAIKRKTGKSDEYLKNKLWRPSNHTAPTAVKCCSCPNKWNGPF